MGLVGEKEAGSFKTVLGRKLHRKCKSCSREWVNAGVTVTEHMGVIIVSLFDAGIMVNLHSQYDWH